MNWDQERLQALAMVNYWTGYLALTEKVLKEEREKCLQPSEMDQKLLAGIPTIPSTESQGNHGSNVTSALSASQDPNPSDITGIKNSYVSNVPIK